MKEIIFSQIGLWSIFTIVFIFAFMGYFLTKMIKLSGDKDKLYSLDSDKNA